jgi:hypothetical protein
LDWQLAITRNREALTAIIMALINSLGLAGLTSHFGVPVSGSSLKDGAASLEEAVRRTGEGQFAYTLPLHIYTRALAILRPAESALRRLIMIAAMQLSPTKFRARPQHNSHPNFASFAHSKANHIPAFNLIDPLKTFGEQTPDFEVLGTNYHQSLCDNDAPPSTTRICAITLTRRLLALKHALDTVPKQARRLARWSAQRDAALKKMQPYRLSPLRPGPPVGLPKHKRSEAQEVLLECHLLAVYARDQHDST